MKEIKHGACQIVLSQKSDLKLRGYLDRRLEHKVNLVLNFAKFRNFFRKISKFYANGQKEATEEFKHLINAQWAFELNQPAN
jgi:hypothetical protein